MTTAFTTRTGGHPDRRNRGGPTSVERFWSKVNKDGPTQPHMTTPCWVWTASTVYCGYGQFDHDRAHRVSWELTHGPIPPRKNVCHRCDNPPCVNPEHLFLGSQRDNSRDMVKKGRWRGPREEHFAERFAAGGWAKKLTPDVVDAIRAATGTQSDIAARFGITQPVVSRIKNGRRWARQATDGWAPPAGPVRSGTRGEDHVRAILTADAVRSIRSRRADGESVRLLSEEFGVSPRTVRSVVERITWRSVD